MHQECLLLRDDKRSIQAFQGFVIFLKTHLQFENNYILSLQTLEESLRWPIKVYQKEHDKLLKMLDKTTNLLNEYYLLSGRRKRLALLEVLDYQSTFLHVMEHHEEREEQDLFLYLPVSSETLAAWQQCESELSAFNKTKDALKQFLSAAA